MRQSTGQASQRTMPALFSASLSEMSSLMCVSFLSRHTGEVARRAGGGEPHRRFLKRHDLKSAGALTVAFPLRPLRGHLPRMTGEAYDLYPHGSARKSEGSL